MNKKKTIQDLTIKDNFMFGAVMCDENNCTPFNVEMQVSKRPALGRRSRYYHSQVDMELLEKGEGYESLPNAFVIFVCDFDPFGKRRYCYTFENRCLEDGKLRLEDGCRTIFLSTKGENPQEVPVNLVKFLEYVAADLEESKKDFKDMFIKQLQNSVLDIKRSREMGERYMTLEELIRDEREEARLEGREEGRKEGQKEGLREGTLTTLKSTIFEFLQPLGDVSEELKNNIYELDNEEYLKQLVKQAASSDSLKVFEKKAEQFF